MHGPRKLVRGKPVFTPGRDGVRDRNQQGPSQEILALECLLSLAAALESLIQSVQESGLRTLSRLRVSPVGVLPTAFPGSKPPVLGEASRSVDEGREIGDGVVV